MNNISKLLLGAAALVGLASCSNDEPVVGPEENGVSTTDIAYLNIKIASPDDVTSRAADDPFKYEYGETEQDIDNAWFFFYYSDGKYANIKTNNFLQKEGDQEPNIEYKSKGTLILENMSGKQYPNYVVTVLNLENPETFEAPANLKDWANISNWNSYWTKSNGDKRFVMVTSSYFKGTDDTYYFATPLVEANFMQETPDREEYKDSETGKRVEIFVERLAARVEVKTSLKDGTAFDYEGEKGTMFPTGQTIGGEDNDGAKTTLYVSFGGWELTTTAKNTLAAKSLDGWTANESFGNNWKWNDPDFHRSYWGKSLTYGKTGTELTNLLNFDKTWEKLSQIVGVTGVESTRAYCNENTNEYANVIGAGSYADPSKATTVLLQATVRDENGKPVDLVEFRGVHYLKADFIKTALSICDMPYSTRTLKETVEVVENGVKKNIDVYDYTTITENECMLVSANNSTGSVNVAVVEGEYWNPGELVTEVYTWTDESNNEVTKTVNYHKNAQKVAKATIDTELKTKVHVNNQKAIAATSGAVYYPIVIEHLNFVYVDKQKVPEKLITRDGMIGVVRNHSYQINISKINSLGEGVFKPTTVGGDAAEIIKPEGPKDPTYYVESTINILSWKLVEQEAKI